MKKKNNSFPTSEEIVEILSKKNEALARLLTDELLELMMANAVVKRYPVGKEIIKQHKPSDSLYIVLEGRCHVLINDELISQMETGDLFGEMGVIQNMPRSATVITTEKTRALRIPGADFKKMLYNPKLAQWIMVLLTDRLKRSSLDAVRAMKEKEEILQDQIELARVQRSLLPNELPTDMRVRLQVLYSPCTYAGGDYYDSILLDHDRLLLIVADVTGHGAQASISMAIVRSFIHQPNIGKRASTILKRLNNYLLEYGPSQHFVTAQVAILDLNTRKLQYAYAGHPPILLLRNGVCKPLPAPRAYFLRFHWDASYEYSTISLKPGDRIALFTDGVVETFNPSGAMFNMEGLQNLIVNTRMKSLPEIPSLLEAELKRFRKGSPVEDDITFLVAEIQ